MRLGDGSTYVEEVKVSAGQNVMRYEVAVAHVKVEVGSSYA